MSTIFGASWKTSMAGYALMVIGIIYTLIQAQGIPHDTQGWIQLIGSVLVGILGRVAKDGTVSNAPNPLSESKPVS